MTRAVYSIIHIVVLCFILAVLALLAFIVVIGPRYDHAGAAGRSGTWVNPLFDMRMIAAQLKQGVTWDRAIELTKPVLDHKLIDDSQACELRSKNEPAVIACMGTRGWVLVFTPTEKLEAYETAVIMQQHKLGRRLP